MASTRRRSWADQRLAGVSVVAGTPVRLDLLENAPTIDTLTVVRIIGDLTVQYTPNSTVVDSLSIIDMGIGVASVEAFATGSAGLPSPSAETQFPPRGWLYVASRPVSQQLESAGTGALNEVSLFQFDIRAMRKIDKGILFWIIENTDILTGGSIRVTGRIRTLCLT